MGMQISCGEIIFGVGIRTRINLNSEDVIHSFSVNKLNVHMDSLPGRISSVRI